MKQQREKVKFSNIINKKIDEIAEKENESKNKGDSSINYTFDGQYFENIEKIGDFPQIIN
jgi:hypothetical protein